MLIDLAINLLAAFVGFLLARAYRHYKSTYDQRIVRGFWMPKDARKIYLHCGQWKSQLAEIGEVEPTVNFQDALTLGELRAFLQRYYSEVAIVTETRFIDWRFPVVSLGGPLSNHLTAEIGQKNLLPLWFLDLPYSHDSERAIGTLGKAVVFKSEFDGAGHLKSDVGFVARLRSPENEQQTLFVIAGNYGVGNLGVVKHITSSENLKQLALSKLSEHFQVVICSRIARDDTILHTEAIHAKQLD